MEIGNKVKLKGFGLLIAHLLGNEGDDFIGEIIGTEIYATGTEMYSIKFPKGFKGTKGSDSLKLYEDGFEVIGDIAETEIKDEFDEFVEFLKMLGIGVVEAPKTETKFKPYIKTNCVADGGLLGNIGDKTSIKDFNGSVLYVGDIVSIFIDNNEYITIIGFDDIDNTYTVVGAGALVNKDGTYGGFTLTKLIDHSIAHEYSDIIDSSLKIEYVMSGEDNE